MNNKQRIAVTGATGFLGCHLSDRLINDGYDVRILARDNGKAKRFEGLASKIVIADITDKEPIIELVKDADVVIHLVSNFRTASGLPESYKQINVEGTLNVLHAAKEAGVKRFIHCSTIGVHGNVKKTPANETSEFNPGDLYQETKLEAENAVRNEIGKGSMEIVIIRPCSMYGPGDMRMLKMFRMLAKRMFLKIGACKENFHAVYIDDIVDGFVLAIETRGISGETFIIGGEKYLPLKDYIKAVADAVGAPLPWLRFPYWLFYYASVICESICVPLGIEPPLHPRRVRFYKNNRAFDINNALSKLNYRPKVGLEEGLRRTVEWYKKNGFL